MNTTVSAYAAPGIYRKQPKIDKVNESVCELYGINVLDLKIHTKRSDIVEARQIAMYYRKTQMYEKPVRIAEAYTFDHATVLHAVKQISNLLSVDNKFKTNYNEFLEILSEKMKQ